jgi:predicted Zn-dependent peptidase
MKHKFTSWWNLGRLLTVILMVSLLWSSNLSIAQARTSRDQVSFIAPYLEQVIKQVTEFKLDNGLKFIVLENHDAPIISFVTYANVGGVDEPDGQTGVAHFLEHLAFKGTREIGTINYEAERVLLDRLDQIFEEIQAARAAGDDAKIAQLQAEFQQVQTEANQYVRQNEYGQIVEIAGGTGLNAVTSADYTMYFYSFPANKLELWMSLESERFLEPVFREFHQEKDVILEERRLRTDNSPIGKLFEVFSGTAFTTHPYKRPIIGYQEDIENLTRNNVEQFFETYYPPSNLTIAIVGDVNPKEVQKLAKTYFGRFSARSKPEKVTTVEPPQTETREVTLELASEPWYIEGYHRPNINHPDNMVYALIASLMGDGRTSRLYRSLVEDQQVALVARGASVYPGDRYDNLMLFYALTAPNHSLDDLQLALRKEIERLKNEPVSQEELDRVKTQAKAGILRGLNSTLGMAQSLAEYDAKTGDWRNLFRELDAIAAVTVEDIQRVAQKTFVSENMTVAKLVSKR